MPNKSKQMTEMPTLDPSVRCKNFDEVAMGYSQQQALDEAARCLNCKTRPCVNGCPVNVQIPEFISLISNKDFEGAYQKIKETNGLPAICGRVCPQESQCEMHCVRKRAGDSVGIGRLERFAADWHMQHETEPQKIPAKKCHKKVAIVGSGPAGLACAAELAHNGAEVVIYEAFHETGGVLRYGIPEFRLPKKIVEYEISKLEELGVVIMKNIVIGKTFTIPDLWEMGFDAVFIGSGAGLPSFLGIPGENANGVYSANEFLTRINLMKAYLFPHYKTPVNIGEHVVVIGGGNVAMDAARSALRLGAGKVSIVYRRSMQELPARHEEVEHAQQEGVNFMPLKNPVEILTDDKNNVIGLKCVEMELGEPDDSGRRAPVEIIGSEHTVTADMVIIAIGQKPNPIALIDYEDKVHKNKRGGIIITNELSGQTTAQNVYAGGDAVTGAATVILAMGAGRSSAKAILNQNYTP